jgi:putative colanic acid biosynthesis acetyltransferase WcaF
MTKILPGATGSHSQAPGGRSFRYTAVRLSAANRVARVLWRIVWITAFRFSPTVLHGWRRLLLRVFGAHIAPGARPYPRARIWAPWNLVMEAQSCIADDVDCYCVASITVGTRATISQYSYLCSASHDYRDPAMPLIVAPIVIEAYAWVAADVFVGPGVKIGEGAVVGARSTVVQDVASWTVVAGAPAVMRGTRPKLAGVTGLQ